MIHPLRLTGSAALLGAGAVLLFLTTRAVVPALVSATGSESVVMWFLVAGIVLFGPLLLIAAFLLYRERSRGARDGLRAGLWLRPMNGGDWPWAMGAPKTFARRSGRFGDDVLALARI